MSRRRAPLPIHRARQRHATTRRFLIGAVAAVVVLAAGWTAFALLRSAPRPRLSTHIASAEVLPGAPLRLSAASGVEEAVALRGTGTIAVAGQQISQPIASLAKIMSAFVILRDHPLAIGQSGPSLVIDSADVAAYRLELAQGDSVLAVRLGERLTELQALEASLVPSADNIVQLLARWDAGSAQAFAAKMNTVAHQLGLDHTHYQGPSGVNPATTSTAVDQLHLAEIAVENPVFAGIVSMAQVSLPDAGVQYNVDADLGRDGIDGIKTGWVPAGGGCFVFSARDGSGVPHGVVLGVVLGEQGTTPIPTVLAVARTIVRATAPTIRVDRIAAGTTVATLSLPYGAKTDVVTTSTVNLVGWSGGRVRFAVRIDRHISPSTPGGRRVGTLVVTMGSARRTSALRTTTSLHAPSLSWRFTNP